MEPIPRDERERARERGIWRAMAVQRERARSSSRGRSAAQRYLDDSDDGDSDDDDYETFDERVWEAFAVLSNSGIWNLLGNWRQYMQEFDDQEIQETINRFIDEHPSGPFDER